MIIKTSRQLKDKVSNLSGNDSKKAQTLIRKYMMERFLARIARSEYKNNFILKGGNACIRARRCRSKSYYGY